MFDERVHSRTTSPDNRWAVVITKQMNYWGAVEVRLQVLQNWGSSRVLLDMHLDERDLWSDVEPKSYEVEWRSGTEFIVGSDDPELGAWRRGRLINIPGALWAIDAVP